jgi:hypothetical protein
MQRVILLTIAGCLLVIGWASAQQQEILDHPADIHMQKMQDASCPPSSGSGGQ